MMTLFQVVQGCRSELGESDDPALEGRGTGHAGP